MFRSMIIQVAVIATAAVGLGTLNNLRPAAKIPWVRHWPSYSALAAEEMGFDEHPAHESAEQGPNEIHTVPCPEADPEARARIMADLQYPVGIQDIGIEEAFEMHCLAAEVTFWIDARNKEEFQESHIEGAHLLDFYNQSETLDDVLAAISACNPTALVIYCKGKDCYDSHFLAEDLSAMGFPSIFVFRDGFEDWHLAGYPVESETKAQVASSVAPQHQTRGMYLEHVIRDMLPFVMGFVVLIWFLKSAEPSALLLRGGALLAGLFFVWASVPKILNPLMFAKDIWNYDLAPSTLINAAALFMPWLELLAGAGLALGLAKRGSAVVLAGLLLLFTAAVSFNMLRGHEFDCGCTSQHLLFTDVFLPFWNDKITLLMRDVGLLILVAAPFFKPLAHHSRQHRGSSPNPQSVAPC